MNLERYEVQEVNKDMNQMRAKMELQNNRITELVLQIEAASEIKDRVEEDR